MAFDTYWRSMYSDALLDLAGNKYKSILKEFVSKDNKGGDAVWFDAMTQSDAAREVAMASATDYRKDFEAIATPDIDDFLALQTPHTEISKSRTLCTATRIDAGYTFRDMDEVAQGWKENSDVMRQLLGTVRTKEDKLIYDALFADTQNRGKDAASLSAVAFDTGQILDLSGTLVKEDINSVRQLFEENYVNTSIEPIFMAITPKMKADLITADIDYLQNKDFVDSRRYFETGELPNVLGVHLIVDPFLANYASTYANGRAVAWTMDAIKFNEFRGMAVEMDKAATQKFQSVLYMSEFLGACRRDDKRVVRINLA